jgi:hypothetical protein
MSLDDPLDHVKQLEHLLALRKPESTSRNVGNRKFYASARPDVTAADALKCEDFSLRAGSKTAKPALTRLPIL